MSERDELIDCLRYRPVATTAAQMREAADLLERDGAEIARLLRWQEDAVALCAKRQCGKRDQRIAELEADIAQVTERLHRREADLLAQMNTNIEVGNLLDAARAALAETRRELLAARKVIASSRVVAQWAEPVTDSDWTEYDAAQRDLREYDAIMRDAPVEVPHGECPYPIRQDHSIAACVEAGDCGCGEQKP